MLSSRDVCHSLLRRPVIILSASLSFQQDPRLQQSVNLSPGHKSPELPLLHIHSVETPCTTTACKHCMKSTVLLFQGYCNAIALAMLLHLQLLQDCPRSATS